MHTLYQTGIVQSSGVYTNVAIPKFGHIGNNKRMRNNLEKMRKMAGLTRADLASRLNTTETTIYRKERGERQLRTEELEIYANALGCAPEELIQTNPSINNNDIDEELMRKAANAIQEAARSMRINLELAQAMVYTVKLYNHVKAFRRKGETIEPTESNAVLILKQIG